PIQLYGFAFGHQAFTCPQPQPAQRHAKLRGFIIRAHGASGQQHGNRQGIRLSHGESPFPASAGGAGTYKSPAAQTTSKASRSSFHPQSPTPVGGGFPPRPHGQSPGARRPAPWPRSSSKSAAYAARRIP